MKKALIASVLIAIGASAIAQEQKTGQKQETTYRRSSLYTIMLPDDKLVEHARDAVTEAFLQKSFPDKYNNHCLNDRVLDLASIKNIEVTPEEVAAAQEQGAKGIGGLLKKGLGVMKSAAKEAKISTDSVATLSDADYVAKLQKYFETHNTAGALVAKWFGGPDACPQKIKALSVKLIEERGINTLSPEELEKAKLAVGGMEKLIASASYDLMGRTFVMVNRYSYLSAEDVIAYSTIAAAAFFGNYATLAGSALASVLKGYFVKTSTYLFQLDLTQEQIMQLSTKYQKDIRKLYTDNSIKLKYVGKTWDYAPATLKMSVKSQNDALLIERATIRATDGAISKLQKRYEQFKTLATLHQDGENLYAYIGAKEGCKEGDKFEVLQKTIDKEGVEVYKAVGVVKIEKGQLWDNRNGINLKVEGAATDEKKKDKEKANSALSFSGFGTSKKLLEGSLIRQIK